MLYSQEITFRHLSFIQIHGPNYFIIERAVDAESSLAIPVPAHCLN